MEPNLNHLQCQKEITNRLYQDYKFLRKQLVSALIEENPQISPLEILQHTQTILDRILFIVFAEHKGLLPEGTFQRTYETDNSFNSQSIWKNFKSLFKNIEQGTLLLNLFVYSGALFAPNTQLDSLQLSDIYCEGFKKFDNYDFVNKLNVNALGHIFEQSIKDLEELRANIGPNLTSINRRKSKRKKDGIFYTPSYITRYIVEQSIGRWLDDRKEEIGFFQLPKLTETDYASIKIVKGVTHYNKQIKQHIKAWESYKAILSNIKVLDPACGSGAFINEAFDYLYQQGQIVNSKLANLTGGEKELFQWDRHILANNLYGVDLNHKSVEITRLSLWLKTANRNEKPTYLDNNIRCGNALIDDIAIAGKLAFQWEEQFPEIMQAGGFDIVVGNPPWGATIEKEFLAAIKLRHAHIIVRMVDSYMFFMAQAVRLTKVQGYNGWLVPDSFLYQVDNKQLRQWLTKTYQIKLILNIGNIFDDVTRPCAIAIFKNADNNGQSETCIGDVSAVQDKHAIYRFETFSKIDSNQLTSLPNFIWPTRNLTRYKLFAKYSTTLKQIIDKGGIQRGVSPDLKDAFIANKDFFESKNLEQEFIKPTVTGGDDVKRFYINESSKALLYITKESDALKISKIIDHIANYRNQITCLEVADNKHPFYTLHRARDEEIFTKPQKILGVITGDSIITAVDENYLYPTDGLYLMSPQSEFSPYFVVAVLNSRLATYLYRLLSGEVSRVLAQVKPKVLENLPFILASSEQQKPLIEKAQLMLSKNKELIAHARNFLNLLKIEFKITNFSNRLQQWYLLDFATFINELTKIKVFLTLKQKTTWLDYFQEQQAIALALKATIDRTDIEIDELVYQLYGLTDEEIAIVKRERG